MNQAEVRRRQIQMGANILGLLSIWILGRRLGDNGITYLIAALEGFWLLWCITGAYVSDTLGRVLRSRNARSQYKNADKMRRNIMLLLLVLGIVAVILLLCGAGYITEQVFAMPYSRFLLLLLAPALLFKVISSVVSGYFQGNGSELPTAVTAVLRQVLFLGFALFFSDRLREYGVKVSALLGQEAFTAMYGGVGVVIAILLTEVLIAVFLILLYMGSRRAKSGRNADGMKATDSFISHVRLLYRNMAGKILLGLLEGIPLCLGLLCFRKDVTDISAAANDYGVYVGKYLVACGVIILLNAMIIFPMNAKVVAYIRKEELRFARHIFRGGLRVVVLQALFFAVFVAVMAKQLAGVVDGAEALLLTNMFSYGSVLILTVLTALFFSRLLLLLGKEPPVFGCAAIGDVVFFVACNVLLKVGKQGIMAVVYAGILGTAVYAVLTGILVCRQLRTGLDFIRTVAIPAGSACVAGLLCLFLGKLFTPHLGSLVTVIVCLILGSMLYLALVLLFRAFREQELDEVPGGRMYRAVGQLLRVL